MGLWMDGREQKVGRRFFFGGADFFFAKRLFFRYGEGCEGRASRATVGVTAKDNGGACFPLVFGIMPTIGRQPSHPHRSGFFYSFHATYLLPPIGIWNSWISGRVKIFFVGLQNFIYFWKLKLEMGLSTSAFCPWLAQPQCGYRLIISA